MGEGEGGGQSDIYLVNISCYTNKILGNKSLSDHRYVPLTAKHSSRNGFRQERSGVTKRIVEVER